MAEGDTILRTARRIEQALGGQDLSIRASNARGRATGVERLDVGHLDRMEARGKHLLFHFDELVLHSHLGMNGSWQVVGRGDRWRKPASAAWVVLSGEQAEAVQFGGPTLRVLSAGQLRRDPVLARLGPDILAPDFEISKATRALRASPTRELGDALLDQRAIAGIGNIFKSESCFAARVSPWLPMDGLTETDLGKVLETARHLMQESVASGRPSSAIYRRAGQPCPICATPIVARGQGDANRRTYWCPRCQAA